MDESVAIVAVPFPAQGHLSGMLHLSLQLASRGLPVHFAVPRQHVRQARDRVHGWDPRTLRSIEFHGFEVPAYASPPPDPAAPSPFPSHLMPMAKAFVAGASAPVAALLSRVSSSGHRRVVVLYDRLSSFAAPEAARIPNGEAFCVTFVAASYDSLWTDAGQRLLRERGLVAPPVEACTDMELVELILRTQGDCQSPAVAGVLLNTCRAIEDEFVNVAAEDPEYRGKKIFAVGPINPLLQDDATARTEGLQPRHHHCLDWLDKQPLASVLYVSFGTTSTLPAEQVAELAAALRDSKQRFLWVLREADRGVVHEEEALAVESRHAKLISEFTRQTEGRGLVITQWAPQLEILAHRATAAFMSHCGWNSTMESLSHGKSILAWPMHSDQPLVAELVCKYLKAGILVRPWDKHGVVTPSDVIREAIDKAMGSDEGSATQERAKALRYSIRASLAEGGSSRKDFDDFFAYITR